MSQQDGLCTCCDGLCTCLDGAVHVWTGFLCACIDTQSDDAWAECVGKMNTALLGTQITVFEKHCGFGTTTQRHGNEPHVMKNHCALGYRQLDSDTAASIKHRFCGCAKDITPTRRKPSINSHTMTAWVDDVGLNKTDRSAERRRLLL